MKNPKGTVAIQAYRGMLRLQLPRHLFNGQQKYLYLGLPDTPTNRRAAEQRADAIAADIAFDRFDESLARYRPTSTAPDTSPLLGELWEKYVVYKAKSLSTSTIEKDFKRVSNHIKLLPTQRLKHSRQIKNFLLNKLSLEAAKKILMQFSACCDWAVGEELIAANPFKNLPKIKTRKQRKMINPFTSEERDRIIEAFNDSKYYSHYAPFVRFLFLTGCRTSEAIGLQWKHIAPDLSIITFCEPFVLGHRKTVTKTGGIRKFPVNQQLKNLLLEIKPPDPSPETVVFPSPEGVEIDAHNFLNRAWKKTMQTLPIDYRPQYNTRHTFISLCLEAGVQVKQVADWAGNSPDTIWKHYAGIISGRPVPEFK